MDTVPRPAKLSRLGPPGLVVAATFLAFLPGLWNGFVNWDDGANFLDNPHYRGLSPSHLVWMFSTFHMGHYQPLTWLTLGLDHAIWGMNPKGYHLTSLLLHAANAALLYLLIHRLLPRIAPGLDEKKGRWAAALGALFHAVHPLRVESVTWITERRDVLAGLFFLLAILAYLRMHTEEDRGGPRGRWLALSAACFAGSLLSKALGIMLPAALLALDVWPLGRWRAGLRRRVLLEKGLFALIAAADAAVMLRAMGQIQALQRAEGYDVAARVMQGAYGLCFYVWKTLLPLDLSPLYLLESRMDPSAAKYVVCLLLCVVAGVILMLLARRRPGWAVAAFCYAALVAPVLGFVVTGQQIVADRYSYLSCIPFAALVAAALGQAAMSRWRGGVAAAALLLLGGLTAWQVTRWHDSITLWSHAIRLDPGHTVAYTNRGLARQLQGDLAGAFADLDAALRINPGNADALMNRGNLREQKEDVQGAFADCDRAISISPGLAQAWSNRGRLKLLRNDREGAAADCSEAIRLSPGLPEPRAVRGLARESLGDAAGAAADYEAALRLAPPEWPQRTNVERFLRRARGPR